MPHPLPPHPAIICEFLVGLGVLRTYPIIPYSDNDRYTEPKYDTIRCIQIEMPEMADYTDSDEGLYSSVELEDLVNSLPGAFVKRWKHGFGLTKRYRPIIGVIERLGRIREVHLTADSHELQVLGDALSLPMTTFTALCDQIRGIDDRANTVALRFKNSAVYNSVAEAFDLPRKPPSRGRHPITRLFSDEISGSPSLTDSEQRQLLNATISQARTLARKSPQALAELRVDVDIANLDELIEQFSGALHVKHPESYWQAFFQRNPFALHLAFGYPLIQVQGQTSVGGATLSGREGRFADFLAKNSITGNIAIFEIKKPATPIISRSLYRTSVYPPTVDLTGAIGQVLDQRNELSKSLPQLKDSTHIYDIHAFAIRCCVVIGRLPEDDARRKSLEAFRGNLHAVDIITYDELLEKLKQLRELLVGASS